MKQRIRYFCLTLLVMVAGMASAQNVAKVGDTEYPTLQGAFNAATDGQTVTLMADYNAANESMAGGTRQFVINKSITLDGGGHTLTTKQRGIGIGNVNSDISSNINVTIKNITIKNTSSGARCIDTRGKIGSLTLEGVKLKTDGAQSGYTQPLTIGGNQSDVAEINITNSTIQTNEDGTAYYAIITFNPVNMTISNSTLKGWACIYAKGADGSAGSAGSTFTLDGCTVVSKNVHSGTSNAFAAFKIDDNDVKVSLKDTEVNIIATGDQKQAIAAYSESTGASSVSIGEGCSVNLTGDNAVIAFNDANDGYIGYGTVAITDGTYNSDPTLYLADGYKAVSDNGTWTVQKIVYVAQIGEGENAVKYESLADAFAVVNDRETITMLTDVTISDKLVLALEGKSVILNLGEKTLTGRMNLTSGNLTVMNGHIVGGSQQALNVYGSATNAENYSVLTIADNVTVTADVYGVCLFGATAGGNGYGAVVNIAGEVKTEGTGAEGTVFVSGNLGQNIAGDMKNVINITGKVTSTNDAGVALNGNATVNVKKGAEITGNTGIAVKRGVLNVEDGATVHATGTENLNPDPNNNGTEMTGAAISMTDTYNNYGAMAVNITGGTFTSDNTVALFKEDGTYTNDATFSVSGGTFSSAVPAEFCAPGYMPTTKNKDDNTYSVTSVVMTVSAGTKTNVIENSGTIEVLNGESVTVYVTFTPDNISDKKAVFSIGDITKAGILSGLAAKEPKESGTSTSVRVKGLAEGETTLTVKPNAMADGAFVQTFTVKVLNNDVASVTGPDGNVTNYTSLEAALNAVPDGVDNEYTVTLLKDSKGKGIATNTTEADTHNKNIVLDLNGHTYTVTLGVGSTGSTNQAIHLNTGSKLTVKNGTIEAKPTVQSQVVMFGQIYGDLVLEDAVMDVTGIKATITTNQFNFNSGNATIKGNSEIKLRDGDFINVNLGSEDGNYPAGAKLDIQNITLATGTLKANGGSTAKETAGLTISGGTFNAVDYGTDVDASMINISGGTFNAPVPEQYCAEGYVPTDLGDGKYSVKKAPVAKIGETTYTSLADAFTAATDNQTITVLTDIDLPSTIAVTKQVTLDLDRKKIFNTSDLWVGDNWSFFSVQAGGNLTVTGDGTIDAKENDCYTFDVRNGGILTIKNGTFTGNISSVYLYNKENIGVSTCNIEGGTFSIKQLADESGDRYRFLLNCYDASYKNNTAKFNVTGGSFVNFNPANNLAEGAETNFCAAGYEAVQDGNVWTVQKAPVAQIGETTYTSLAEAFEAAQTGQTITVLTDIDLPSTINVTKQVTLDLNGKTISNTSDLWVGGNWSFFSVRANGNLTVGNGTIDAKENDCFTFDVRDGGILTIKDGTYTGNISSVYLINEAGTGVSTCNIEGGTFSIKQLSDEPSDKYRFLLNCLDASYTSNTAKFNVTGGSFENFNPANNLAEGTETNFCAAGYEAVQDGNVWTVQKAAVAQIEGGAKYETLQAAINACEAGTETTIKLLDNVTDGAGFAIPDGVTNKNIIIDFDGKFYNVTKDAVGSGNTKTQAMHFYSGNTLTLKNGTITSAATSEENKLKMMMQNYCDLTLDGMTIDCSNVNGGTYPDYSGTAYEYWSNKSVPVFNFNTGNATIKNTTITFRDGDNMGLCVDGGTVALGEGTVVNGPVSAVTGTVTITGGKYSGAVTSDQATLKISGGIFTIEPAAEYCAEGFVVTDNKDEATKEQYPYTVKSKEEAGIFVLYDKEPYKYVDEMPASEVTYVRSFGTKNVQSWYVPFDYTITEEDANNFSFYKIHMIAASGNQQGGDVSDNTKVYIYIEPLAAGTLMKANRPYVIQAENPVQNYNFIAKDIDKLYKPDDTSRLHNETTEFTYDFFGTYGLVYCDDALHWIAISGGLACPLKENAKVQQYRWYIKISPKSYHDDYAKLNFIFVEGDGETNGISAQTIDGEIEGIYTLGGMKVEHPVKGVNIIKYTDGRTKKIYVK